MSKSVHGRRIAFFGGSFDPPHLGHLAVARAARTALGLDRVLFAPVGVQPLKPRGASASFSDRVAMTALAIKDDEGFEVSLADAPAVGHFNYTIDTLLKLRAELEPEAVLFCLMGADSFRLLRQWHRAAEIPFVAPLIVAARPGERLDDLKAALPEGLTLRPLPGAESAAGEVRRYLLHNADEEPAPFYLLPGLAVEISASGIRRQVRATTQNRQGGHALLACAVSDYIRSHQIYL